MKKETFFKYEVPQTIVEEISATALICASENISTTVDDFTDGGTYEW